LRKVYDERVVGIREKVMNPVLKRRTFLLQASAVAASGLTLPLASLAARQVKKEKGK
jgi:hypothetical protein